VTAADFASSLDAWHDFYLAAAGASAALLGLLFVGISINLASITADERTDLRALAEHAFANLLWALVVALIMLEADPRADGVGSGLAIVAGVGLLRAIRSFGLVRRLSTGRVSAARRLSWTLVANLLIGYVATRFLLASDAGAAVVLMTALFVLMLGAADIAWTMLVEVTTERPAAR
jgi:hypothetical protein